MCTTAPVSSAACQKGARSGASSTLPTPRGSVPIMTPGKPADTAARSTSAAAAPVLQRHGGERHEARLGLGGRGQVLVDELRPRPCPRRRAARSRTCRPSRRPPACRCRSSSIQATRPAMSPSGLETGRVGLAPANEKASEPCSLDRAHRRKARRVAADRLEQRGRDQMRVAVDDHGAPPWSPRPRGEGLGTGEFPLARIASAMASPMAEMRMGSASKRRPRWRTASLTALEMRRRRAQVPRTRPSPSGRARCWARA